VQAVERVERENLMASSAGHTDIADDSASPALDSGLSRRQEELMKKAERLMRAELDDILEVTNQQRYKLINIRGRYATQEAHERRRFGPFCLSCLFCIDL
jgi:hypothetical protein